MLRFIVYRYIFYKDSKISHASPLALRHHLPQPPQLYYTLPYYTHRCTMPPLYPIGSTTQPYLGTSILHLARLPLLDLLDLLHLLDLPLLGLG